MRIGDKVRLLRGTEEGLIVNIKGNKFVEVEIEDGFIIPALMNEVVVIDKNEAANFQKEDASSEEEEIIQHRDLISDGIYLGLVEKLGNQFDVFFINQTVNTVLYSVSQFDKKINNGISFGVCNEYSVAEIGSLTSSIFNDSKRLNVQLLIHENQTRLKKQPINVELKIKKEQLKEKIFLQSIEKDITLINLEETLFAELDPADLQEKMMDSNPFSKPNKEIIKGPREQTVDLHVENLSLQLKSEEILDYQLNAFEKAFDNALLSNSEKLKVIHGVGAGILRSKIHKRLSMKKEVKFFEDGDKEKFGFGSTIIYF